MFSQITPKFRVICLAQDPMDQIAMQDYAWILGWDLSMCRDLDDCMDVASTGRVNLIVSDLFCGPPCGIDLVKSVRLDCAINVNVPALLLADAAFPEKAVRRANETGAVIVRRKPLLLSDLKSAAERLNRPQCGHYGSAGTKTD